MKESEMYFSKKSIEKTKKVGKEKQAEEEYTSKKFQNGFGKLEKEKFMAVYQLYFAE